MKKIMVMSVFATAFVSFLVAADKDDIVLKSSAVQPTFDRSKLVPLEKSVPLSAQAPKPDYSRPRDNVIKPTKYRVVHESSVGGEPLFSFASSASQLDASATANNDSFHKQLSNATSWYAYTMPSGQVVYIPLQTNTNAGSANIIQVPSKATYRIIEIEE